MPKKIIITSKDDLEAVVVPTGAVSHKEVMDTVALELSGAGHAINKEVYIKNLNGTIATGIYHLDANMMISWTNSYDGTMSFKCSTGAYVASNDSYAIGPDSTGHVPTRADDIKTKMEKLVKAQVSNLNNQMVSLVDDINKMKNSIITGEHLAHIIGTLYFKEDVINSSQLIKIKKAYDKSTNMWDIYRLISVHLKDSHPKSWMNQQRGLHTIIMNEYKDRPETSVEEEVIDPNQTNLLDQIEEVKEESTELTLDSHPGYVAPVVEEVEETVEEPVAEVEEPTGLTLGDYKAVELTEEELADLNKSDTDIPDTFSTDTEEKGETVEDKIEITNHDGNLSFNPEPVSEFPTPPADVPVHKEVVPLEEQVAGEYVSEVSKEEKDVSAEPVVDKPEEDLSFLEEGPTDDPVFRPEDKAKEDTPVIPNFEF